MTHENKWLIDFGIRLRAERDRQGLTRQRLAELANTEQGYIVQIERGERSPSLRTFINILSALGASADSIIFGTLEEGGELDNIIKDFSNFLSRMGVEEVTALYQIAKLITAFKDIESSSAYVSNDS